MMWWGNTEDRKELKHPGRIARNQITGKLNVFSYNDFPRSRYVGYNIQVAKILVGAGLNYTVWKNFVFLVR